MSTLNSPTPANPTASRPQVGRLLIVDDEIELMTALCDRLAKHGYETVGFSSGVEALNTLKDQDFDLLLTDLMMPEMDGIALLRAALEIDPHLVGIIMTGHGTIQSAVEAMHVGAFDYVLKPFDLSALLPLLSRAMGVRRLRMENLELRETLAIYELSKAIAFMMDWNAIVNKIADVVLQQSGADEVSIMLPTGGGEELYVAVVRGQHRSHILGARAPMGRSIAGWVARQQEPVSLNGEVNDPRFGPIKARAEIHSAISMPMFVGNKMVGVLNVNATRRRRPFTSGQIKAMSILCSTGASALESAGLYARIRQAEQKYRSIFENAVEGIFQTSPDGRFLSVNPALARIFGYEFPEEMMAEVSGIGHPLYLQPDLHSEFHRLLEQNGAVQGFESRAYRKDGSVIWISQNVRAVRDANGVLLHYHGAVEDITERKRAEEALRASEERYRLLLERNPAGVFRTTLDGRIVDANDACVRIFGYASREELLAHTGWADYFSVAEGQAFLARLRQQKTLTDVEVCLQRKDGSRIWVLANASLLEGEEGLPPFIEGTLIEITERKQLEEQLRQSQKMEAVGRLAGGIAHDFNNLLTVVKGYSELLLEELGPDHQLHRAADEIDKAADRATSLTRQLLAFSRRQVLEPKVLDLNAVMDNMEQMLRRLIGEDIDLVAVRKPGLGRVKADPGQMEQVIMNLAVNSRDAMPQGGKLTIETANVELDETYARSHMVVQPGPYVMLAVSDTGCGMDAETQARIFEPFFSTKERGKGTGLGLATVYGIVKQSGGSIWVYSELGRGTTFKIYLPQVEEEVESARPGRSLAEPSSAWETILLVEDEESVRKLVRETLQRNGYRVLEARSGTEAAQLCERHPGPIHLLVTDVVMPEVSGRELAGQLASLRPDMKVLYISGYTDNAIVHHGVLEPGTAFLQKPFRPADLARKVREVLEGEKRQ